MFFKQYFIKHFLTLCGRKISVSGQQKSQNLDYIYFSVKLEAKPSVGNEGGSVDGRGKETAYFRERRVNSLGKGRVFVLFAFVFLNGVRRD